MAWKLEVEGIDELIGNLGSLGERAPKIAAQALYVGAGIVADEIRKEAQKIKTHKFRPANGWQRDPSPEEKEAVVSAGLGIARFDKDGNTVNTSIGYGQSGYAEINGHRVAIAQIANGINHGTSFMKKQPFIRKAVSQSKAKAEAAIREEAARLVDEAMKK